MQVDVLAPVARLDEPAGASPYIQPVVVVVVGQRVVRRAVAEGLAHGHALAVEPVGHGAHRALGALALWMSQRSKCCSGAAFITISGGWMTGPAFISAPESASPQPCTLG